MLFDQCTTGYTSSTTKSGTALPEYTIKFFDKEGGLLKEVKGKEGSTILDVAHDNEVDLEGACEGSCACSTYITLHSIAVAANSY